VDFKMPNDPVMLLSYVNTQLRDNFPSLREFCGANGVREEDVKEKLTGIDYRYDAAANQFVSY
jgi:hypothetical protein